MKRSAFLLVVALFAVPLAAPRCLAAAPKTSVNALLAKWEEASQKCKSLDAKLTIWHYDDVFDSCKPTIEHGRFYYESPGIGRFQIGTTSDEKADDWPALSQVIIWNAADTLSIDPKTLVCTQYSKAAIQAFLDADEKNGDKREGGWLARLFSEFGLALANHYVSSQRFLPLVVDVRDDDLRARFDISIDERNGQQRVSATPKKKVDQDYFSKVEVLLDAKTHMTAAIQVFSVNGRERFVYELSDVKINQRPGDRDQLLNPDVSWIGKEQVARMRPLLKDENRYVRAYAAEQLGGFAPEARGALLDLKELLRDKDRSVRDEARAAIKRIESVPACCSRNMFPPFGALGVVQGNDLNAVSTDLPAKHPAEVARIMKLLPKIPASASADEIIKFLGLPNDFDGGHAGSMGFDMVWSKIAPGHHFILSFSPARKDGKITMVFAEAAFSALGAPGYPADDYYTIYPYRSAKDMVYKDY